MAAPDVAEGGKQVHVIGYGSVAQALHVRLRAALAGGELSQVSHVTFWAPEIQEAQEDGPFSLRHCPTVGRETYLQVLDTIAARPGDILVELATRIDTIVFWGEVKRRGIHFCNSAFDAWAEDELDLNCIDNLRKEPQFKQGSGLTAVFSMGMNPGIVSHFVSHGLKEATGLSDVRAAVADFGLRSIIFTERDNQWARSGSHGERLMLATQTRVLYNTWSPSNYIVETAECNLLWTGIPKEAEEINAEEPTFVGWVPAGPIVGFAPPHDECFTVQTWFDQEIPALFIYEASPPARFYLKGGEAEHSSKAKVQLMNPGAFDVRDDCYDMIGVVLLSNKPDRAPFWCGLNMTVADAAQQDPERVCGPTPLEVMGGVWSGLRYILQQPDAGDCFPEDLPTEFVISTAFPHAGRLLSRECPEVLQVAGLFDPASPDALARIRASIADAGRLEARRSTIHGRGAFATGPLVAGSVLLQLPLAGNLVAAQQFIFNHSCDPNAYVDRNRAVRTLRDVPAGEEVTLDYALTCNRATASAAGSAVSIAKCLCGASACRGSVRDWTALRAEELLRYLASVPIEREVEEDLYSAFAPKSF